MYVHLHVHVNTHLAMDPRTNKNTLLSARDRQEHTENRPETYTSTAGDVAVAVKHCSSAARGGGRRRRAAMAGGDHQLQLAKRCRSDLL